MSSLTASIQRIYQFLWNPTPGDSPERSGIYLTRNDHSQEWFRYFDARLGEWHMSWAELQTRSPQPTSRLSDAEQAAEVVAWAHRTRRVHA